MLPNPYEALEFSKVVELLGRYAASPLGTARLERLLAEPRVDSAELAEQDLEIVGEAAEWLRSAGVANQRGVPPPPRFSGVEDVGDAVGRLSVDGVSLDASEIRAILAVLDAAQRIRLPLLAAGEERPLLRAAGEGIPDLRPLVARQSGKILPNDEVSSLASTALSKLRRHIERQRQLVETSLDRFVRKHSASGMLQERYVTMRNGRTVVPVKTEWKGQVDGIVHGTSGSGQTAFVEPLDTIVQNNRLVRLREDEQREILRILREMSGALRAERAAIVATLAALGELDYVFARGRFAQEFACCLPKFSNSSEARIVLSEARHPLLQDLMAQDHRRPVPMSLRLDGERRALIVSGPNAGGKTVVLKTMGVLSAMAQAGIPVPAEEAEFPWFDQILADIGDAQSIAESLSTFSAHVSKLTGILQSASPRTLVVLDELGTATDPEDGGALAVAVVERLLEAGGFVAISTHLPELKMFGTGAPGVVTAAMGFDDARQRVTYRLQSGIPGQSAGIEMASRFGLPREVVRRALALKGRAHEQSAKYLAELRKQAEEYDRLVQQTRERSRELNQHKRQLEQQAAAREKELKAEAEARVERLVAKLEKRFRGALDAAIARVQSSVQRKGERAQARRATQDVAAFRRAVSAEVAAALGSRAAEALAGGEQEFEPGAKVRLVSMGTTGEIVRRLDNGRWEVLAGTLRLQVAGEDVVPLGEEADRPSRLPDGVSLETVVPDGGLPAEINVIGKTADEALSDVDKYLDRAVLANRSKLRVVHGFGKDVLRRELWKMFARHVHVTKYYQAEQHEGGAGATIVEVGDG